MNAIMVKNDAGRSMVSLVRIDHTHTISPLDMSSSGGGGSMASHTRTPTVSASCSTRCDAGCTGHVTCRMAIAS